VDPGPFVKNVITKSSNDSSSNNIKVNATKTMYDGEVKIILKFGAIKYHKALCMVLKR